MFKSYTIILRLIVCNLGARRAAPPDKRDGAVPASNGSAIYHAGKQPVLFRRTEHRRRRNQLFDSVNENVVPTSGVLRTEMVSRCASRICLTMASPRPVPPAARDRLLSTR